MKDKSDQAVPDPGREPGDTEAARMWASIGHEIRTPLMGVVGMLELLGRTALSETQRRLIDTAQESSAALMRIVDDVLDLTAMRTGRLSFHPGPADIGDVVESCAELLARPAEAKGLVLTCEVDPALPEATCDPVRLRQVLLNLGGNALKFTENGQIRFTAERLNADAGWVGIRLTVADTGVGIPEELQAFLFEPFSRLAGTPGRGQGGLGLGLAICRNLIENMGGKIALETAPDTGTKVILTLTFPAATPAPAHRPLEKSKFLFVSDSDPVMSLAARYATAAGAAIEKVGEPSDLAQHLRADRAVPRQPLVAVVGPSSEAEDVVALAVALERMAPAAGARLIWLHGRSAGLAVVGRSTTVTPVSAHPLRRGVLVKALSDAVTPIAVVERAEGSVRLTDTDTAAARTAGRLILVAEDNPINQQVLRQQLAILGYDCDIVGRGDEALKAVRSTRYLLLLCDCYMPDIHGFELTRQVRAWEAETQSRRRLPVVAITANAMPGEAARCRAAGMDDFLAKPIEIRSLQGALDRWVAEGYRSGVDISLTEARSGAEAERDAPALDLTSLSGVYGNDPAKIASVLSEWLSVTEVALSEMRSALAAGKLEGALGAVHRLKGGAGIAGAAAISTCAAELELSLRIGDRQRVATDARKLEQAASAALREARQWNARAGRAPGDPAPARALGNRGGSGRRTGL